MPGELVAAAQILAGSGAAGWLVDKLLGPSADALGDQLKIYASDRMRKIFDRTKEIAEGRKIQPLAAGFALVAIQRASISEDDPNITEMWAHLIADAATKQTNRHVLYAEMLSQIGSEEAILLDRFGNLDSDHFELKQQHAIGDFKNRLGDRQIVYAYGMNDAADKIDQILGIEHTIVGVISRVEVATKDDGKVLAISRKLVEPLTLDILERQRLVESLLVETDQLAQGPKVYFSVLTELGADFLRICKGHSE